ncbi:MAG: carbohydrate kinase family protein [Chloroflexi bacterium]|nr:carbohydrate kinase family protein [Chloroflexota bacterium]
MQRPYDVVLIGNYFFDQILTGLPRFPVLGQETWATNLTTTGGAMYTTAAALHRLTVKVAWPGFFGSDSYSQFVYNLARQEGLDMRLAQVLDHPYQKVTISLPFAGERAFVTYEDDDPDDMVDYWLDVLDRIMFRHLHIGGFMEQQPLMALFEKAHARGATISMDSQDGAHLGNPKLCRDTLTHVDVFMPNFREAQIIAEADTVEETLYILGELVDVVVIKDSSKGSLSYDKDTILRVPSINAGPVVDTTGAGDCFNAGFLLGYVVEKVSLEQCLRYGNICGGLSVTGIGGATTAPTRLEFDDWLSRF